MVDLPQSWTHPSQHVPHFAYVLSYYLQALKDLDFEVRDRLFLESVMDIEFQDSNVSEKAIFYKGMHSVLGSDMTFNISKLTFF